MLASADLKGMERVMAKMSALGLVDTEAQLLLVRALAERGDIDGGMRVVEEVVGGTPFPLDVGPARLTIEKMFTSLIHACAKEGLKERARGLLERMEGLGVTANEVSYTSLINVYGKAGDVKGAFEMLAAMRAKGIQPNTLTFTSLIKACGTDVAKVRGLLKEMEVSGVPLDNFVFSAILSACKGETKGRGGDGYGKKKVQIQQAFELFNYLRGKHKLRPTNFVWNTLLDVCGRAEQFDEVLNQFRQMKLDGITPDLVTYNILLDACAATPKINTALSTALSLLNEMEDEGITPDGRAFSAILRCYAKSAQLENDTTSVAAAFNIVEKMRRLRIPISIHVFTSLLKVCAGAGDITAAMKAVDMMENEGLKPDAFLLNMLLEVLEKRGDWQASLHAIEHTFPHYHLKPNDTTFTILFSTFFKANKLDHLFALWDRPGTADSDSTAPLNKPGTSAFLALLGFYKQAAIDAEGSKAESAQPLHASAIGAELAQQALQVLVLMKRLGVRPDEAVFAAVLSVCARAGDLNTAFGVVQGMMPKEGVTPNVVHYNVLIDACARRGTVERAFAAFRMLKNAKLTPSTVTYSSLINACAKGSDYERAL